MSARSIEVFAARSSLVVLAANCCLLAQSQVSGAREFEAVSVKPHVSSGAPLERAGIEEDKALVRIDNLSLRRLIGIAYHVEGFQIAGPNWLEIGTFDIVANLPRSYKQDQLPALMQKMLSDRFKLAVHRETRPAPGYALVVSRGGRKLLDSAGPRTYFTVRPGLIEGKQRSISELRGGLAQMLDRPVEDRTALTGRYDLKLEWNPQELAALPETRGATEGPSLFTALQEQLGLKLERIRTRLDFIVVDHAERIPIPN
jgi:uncharacterized protein (TIGR03435 family)